MDENNNNINEEEALSPPSKKKVNYLSRLGSGEDAMLESSQIDSMIMKHQTG
jgi:hypothetical protein